MPSPEGLKPEPGEEAPSQVFPSLVPYKMCLYLLVTLVI